ncbi:DUF1108 family protein [Staphylococcus hyicus]|uniref:DUF1108 family protein n=1 Tax=Staphylococcus hyicus TaxID=1284 RepID=UPI00211D14DA|nr:DUF1108 family protein [Staphylococcus hyicus]MCQ9290662.1 DUF1108 family protein [Staphylococcus hyicus]MCQ9305904.1 DUF1108 family protein [Staphylococcus hyicus]MCQ9308316.1 DUF1108 family protein [Staphylococcus hyicus]MCQ9310738.1 DUF1108 family protein [Staphylococcus hyicus]
MLVKEYEERKFKQQGFNFLMKLEMEDTGVNVIITPYKNNWIIYETTIHDLEFLSTFEHELFIALDRWIEDNTTEQDKIMAYLSSVVF